MKVKIRLISNESGDWKVLLLNGKIYEEGHDIPSYTWVNLIRDLGYEVNAEEITDEEMENCLYSI